MGRIVVGVDGSENAQAAVLWAAAEAKLRGASVHVVHSWSFPPAVASPEGGVRPAEIEATSKRICDEAIALVDSDIETTSEVANEPPASALVRCSQDAEVVVVGSRGLGGFKGLLLGSVAQQVAHHAHCPVVIVPGEYRG